MNKTAIQELIEMIDTTDMSSTEYHDGYNDACKWVKARATELLDKEKEQIRNAFSEGRISFSVENGGGEFDDEPIQSFTNANDYYQKTYNQ